MTISRKRLSRLIRECAPTWEGTLSGRKVRLEKVDRAHPALRHVDYSVCVNRKWINGSANTIKDACESICAAVEARMEAE